MKRFIDLRGLGGSRMTLDEVQYALREAERYRPHPEKASVITGSLGNFVKALEKRVGPLKDVDSTQPPAMATFMGLEVREDTLLPANRAVLKLGHQVVGVIDLD